MVTIADWPQAQRQEFEAARYAESKPVRELARAAMLLAIGVERGESIDLLRARAARVESVRAVMED